MLIVPIWSDAVVALHEDLPKLLELERGQRLGQQVSDVLLGGHEVDGDQP